MTRPLACLFLACLMLLCASAVHAQVIVPLPPCIHGDDNFGLGCCTEPVPSYPNFPSVYSAGKYACIADCGLSSETNVVVSLSQPSFFLCDTAAINVSVASGTPGFPSISGTLIAKYSRTWQLTNSGIRQIWRFLLNGDLLYSSPSQEPAAPCPIPPLGSVSPGEHFIGHVDYICDPFQSHVELLLDSFSLHHLPGCISHAPGGARPRTGDAAHYQFSYHLVAPANFTFAPGGGPISGIVVGDAVRPSSTGGCFPSTYSCVGEADVFGGEYWFSNCEVCLCASFPCTGPWRHTGFSVPVTCGDDTQIMSAARGVYPIAPEGLVTLQLGFWAGGTLPLGSSDLFVKFGAVQLAQPCFLNARKIHTVFGVATRKAPYTTPELFGGSMGFPIDTFIDLQNSLIWRGGVTLSQIIAGTPTCVGLTDGFGSPAFADIVIQLNT